MAGRFDGVEIWQPPPHFQKVGESASLDAVHGIGVEFSPDATRFATNKHGLCIRDSATGALLRQHRLPVTPDQIRWVGPETLLLVSSYGAGTFDVAAGDLSGLWAPETSFLR